MAAATVNRRPANSIPPWHGKDSYKKFEPIIIDFSATGNTLATGETMAILDIPAKHKVALELEVITANAGVEDVDIGLSADGGTTAADLLDGGTLAATGFIACTAGAVANAARQLVITNKDATSLSAGKIAVYVRMIDLV